MSALGSLFRIPEILTFRPTTTAEMSSPEASFLFFSSQYISGARSPLAVATSFLLRSWNLLSMGSCVNCWRLLRATLIGAYLDSELGLRDISSVHRSLTSLLESTSHKPSVAMTRASCELSSSDDRSNI